MCFFVHDAHIFHKSKNSLLYRVVSNNNIIYTFYILGKRILTVRSKFHKNAAKCMRKLYNINIA